MIAQKNEFVALINSLYSVKDLKGKTFGLAVSKNIVKIQDSLKDLEDKGVPSTEFLELASKMQELADSGGEDIKERVKALEVSNAELIEDRKKQIEEVKEALKEEMDLEVTTLSLDEIPEDITAEQLLGLRLIIKE